MKATAMWVLRHLLIPVGFVWATGMITWFVRMADEPRNDPYKRFDSAEYATLQVHPRNLASYRDSIIEVRTRMVAETGVYDPFVFFWDLKQCYMFDSRYHDSLDQTSEGRSILAAAGHMGLLGRLTELRDRNWHVISGKGSIARILPFSMSIPEARAHWFPEAAAEEERAASRGASAFWPLLWSWMLSLYLKGMLVSVFLFTVWKIRFKDDWEDASWHPDERPAAIGSGPLSFLYALLVWPVILVRDIRNRGMETLRKADMLSRRRDMLSLFSQEERKLLAVGRSMSLKEFRQHLAARGLVRRRSFVLSLLFLPFLQLSVSHTGIGVAKQAVVPVVSIAAVAQAVDDDVGVDEVSSVSVPVVAILIEDSLPFERACSRIMFPRHAWGILSGFLRHADEVPRVRV